MSKELKPCPFCGREVDPAGWLQHGGCRGPECMDCGATADSVEAWNRRSLPPVPWTELVVLIKRLREAGSTGLDLSPGDPLCADATVALQNLCDHVTDLRRFEGACTAITDWCAEHGRSDITTEVELLAAFDALEADLRTVMQQRDDFEDTLGAAYSLVKELEAEPHKASSEQLTALEAEALASHDQATARVEELEKKLKECVGDRRRHFLAAVDAKDRANAAEVKIKVICSLVGMSFPSEKGKLSKRIEDLMRGKLKSDSELDVLKQVVKDLLTMLGVVHPTDAYRLDGHRLIRKLEELTK